MSKIKVLDPILANKIAAGEVVEWPLSVVKELIENAIDANATKIEVHIVDSGIKSIQIIDNGTGMEKDEAKLAFLRHATSKIVSDRDLFSISSLGFRGEALPAIASVSKITLKTGVNSSSEGVEIELHGGVEVRTTKAYLKGTIVSVEDLFYNTPARLNYLKNVHYELAAITDVLQKFTIAFPHIAFIYSNNGVTLLTTRGDGDISVVLSKIFGVEIGQSLIEIENKTADFEIHGFVSLPKFQKFNRQSIYLVINDRIIKNFTLTKAIVDAFHTYIPTGKYPIAYVNIKLDPMLIDVNVHPTKQEVRISIEKSLSEVLLETIKNKLIHTLTSTDYSTQFDVFNDKIDKAAYVPKNIIKTDNRNTYTNTEREATSFLFSDIINSNIQPEAPKKEVNFDVVTEENTPISIFEQEKEKKIQHFEIIGQYIGTYILGQNESGFILVDQHAAAERIKYEKYLTYMEASDFSLQQLILPIQVKLSQSEIIKLENISGQLKHAGVTCRLFSQDTIAIDELPTWVPQAKEKEYIQMMIEWLLENDQISRREVIEKAAIMMSCKLSIKANHKLSHYEMRDLIDQLEQCENPFTCPHGRPTIITKTKYEIEKWFKRV